MVGSNLSRLFVAPDEISPRTELTSETRSAGGRVLTERERYFAAFTATST